MIKRFVKILLRKYRKPICQEYQFYSEKTNVTNLKYKIKYLYYYIVFGVKVREYFNYNFILDGRKKRKEFIYDNYLLKILLKHNDDETMKHYYNKYNFNKTFIDYTKRNFIDVDLASLEEIQDFLTNLGSVIVKPKISSQGKGIDIIESHLLLTKNIKSEYNGYIIEELIKQHRDLSIIYPNSVNTIRLTTFYNKNNQKFGIIGAALRMGVGDSVVDNATAGGIFTEIDIKTGELFEMAVDFKGNKFKVHPTTKFVFKGFKIPHWDRILNEIEKIAMKIKDIGYVGWDIAISEEGFVLVEGNYMIPDSMLLQQSTQIGKKFRIQEILK